MNKKFSSFLLVPFFVLLLNSCNPNIGSLLSPFQQEPKQKVSAEINPFQTSLATPEQLLMRQQELEKIKNKNVYAGPLSIKIDTGRMEQKNKNAGRIIDVSTLLATQKPSFTIQAIPDGPVVFQERFTKGKGNLEITRAFRVAETSQRYTVHVQKISQKHDNNIQLNINGTDWILEKDFPRHALEIQRDSLLLNTNNSLKIRLKGDTGAAVVVTIVEGGQAGTILKRQKKLGLPGETHETHLRQNDINIFDPNDPESLGGLTPYEGIETITAGSKTYEFSELALNGISVQIENARILMVFKDEQSKQNFLAAYNAEIEQEEYGASLVKFDLSQAPVENLNELDLLQWLSVRDRSSIIQHIPR